MPVFPAIFEHVAGNLLSADGSATQVVSNIARCGCPLTLILTFGTFLGLILTFSGPSLLLTFAGPSLMLILAFAETGPYLTLILTFADLLHEIPFLMLCSQCPQIDNNEALLYQPHQPHTDLK